jgi:hypothetical protein
MQIAATFQVALPRLSVRASLIVFCSALDKRCAQIDAYE